MKKKKGLSLEDKRQIMLSLFKQKDSTFFHYKDIEKFSVKNKISFMIVKDILQGIVADNLIETEKVGSSSFYWCLPSRLSQVKFNNIERNKSTIEQLKQSIEDTEKKIEENKELRQETKARREMLDEDEKLGLKLDEIQKVISNFEKNDPKKYESILKDTKSFVALTDFWNDNIYSQQQWVKTKAADFQLTEMFPELIDLHIFD